MTEACDLSALEARRLIGLKKLSPIELLASSLRRIERVNPAINAVIALDDRAEAVARRAEQAVMGGEPLGLLHGLPIGIKDLEETEGLVTTFGSPLFRDNVPEADLSSVARVRAAGAVIVGKTNTPEFGAGGNTRNMVYGATGNPHDPTKSAAGSSGGSGAALAAGMFAICTGSDTGGSLRNPAAFNGVVGFRPSAGLVPNARKALAWSNLSILGPMANTVGDAALLLAAMAGDDGDDPLAYTLPGEVPRARPERWTPVVPADLSSLRVAATEDFGVALVERTVRDAFRLRVECLAPLFARVDAATPDCSGAHEAFEVLRAVNYVASHADKVARTPEMVGPNVRANVAEGLGYSAQDVARASVAQSRLYRRWQEFFAAGTDLIISPAIAVSPPRWSDLYPTTIDGMPTRTYFHWLAMAYVVTLTGHPAISIPMGRDACGMPFGLQIVGPRGGDLTVLRAAAAIEAMTAGDATLSRPQADLDALARASPIASADGFMGFD